MQKIAIIKLVVCASRMAVGTSENLVASINVLGIISPPVDVGFTDVPKSGGRNCVLGFTQTFLGNQDTTLK